MLRPQEILAARRSGKSLNGVDERRKEVAKYMKLSKDEQRKFREKRSPAEPIYEEDPPWFGTSAWRKCLPLPLHAAPWLMLRCAPPCSHHPPGAFRDAEI